MQEFIIENKITNNHIRTALICMVYFLVKLWVILTL